MKYSFWRLLRAQYSWKNDRTQLFINAGISILFILFMLLFGGVTPVPGATLASLLGALVIVWVVQWALLTLAYHTLKLIIMIPMCALVTQAAKRDLTEAREAYIEMLTWRQ